MSFDVDDWYCDLLTWMREERGVEMLEVQTDCAGELYANAMVALHLRRYGRSRGRDLWWARCEWGKVDISFGDAKCRFNDWDQAWIQGDTGDEGQLEAKILYWHYGRTKNRSILAILRAQLDDRRAKDSGYGRYDQKYLGLLWQVSYESFGEESLSASGGHAQCCAYEEWVPLLAENGLVVRDVPVDRPSGAVFDRVATLDVNTIWPVLEPRTATLWLTLVEATLP